MSAGRNWGHSAFSALPKKQNVPIKQRGSVLLPVVIAIVLLASITFMLSSQAVNQTNIVAAELERDQLTYVAEAGLAHGRSELALNTSCDNYVDIPKTAFAGETYSVAFSPNKGSPVNIESSVTLEGGKTLNVRAAGISTYQPATTVILQLSATSGKDTFLEESFPDRNYGASGVYKVESAGANWRPMLEFDIDAIPAGATILSATLQLTQFNVNSPGQVFAHRITRDWVEGTKNGGGAGDGASWNTFDGTTPWTTPGGDFDSTVYGTSYLSSSVTRPTWDITSLVQLWVSGEFPNYGMILIGDSNVRNVGLSSSASNNPPDQPQLTISYACECGKTCGAAPPAGKNVLMVVGDPANLTPQDTAKQALIEGWGHTVTMINDGSTQAEFDAAVTLNDVAYISEEIISSTLDTKLRGASIGVVIEEQKLPQEFGISSSDTVFTESSIEITDNSHYITQPFSLGTVAFANSTQPVGGYDGTLAPDLQTLAVRPSTSVGTIVVIEAGGALYDSGNAAGRRVKLPWGDGGFDINALTADGQTIMKRAIEWGAGDGVSAAIAPIAHWKLDETSGTTAVDSAGGNDGTLAGDASWAPGVLDGGLSLDGAGDRVDVSGLVSSPSSLTITAWVNLVSAGFSGDEVISLGNNVLLRVDSALQGGSYASYWDGSSYRQTTSGQSLGGSGWRHIAYTFDDAADQQFLYIDGVEAGSSTFATSISYTQASNTTIGAHPSSSSYDFNGQLDDVRIYDRALSASEISELAVASTSGPIAHWKLDETSGTTVVDSVGGNNGQLIGSGAWTSGEIDGGLAVDYTDGEDYVQVPNTTGLENVQEGDYTLAAWFRPASTPPGASSSNDAAYGILIKRGWHTGIFFTDQNRFGFWNHLDGNINIASTSGNTFSPGAFYHVAATVDRAAGLQSLYVNGVLEDTSGFTPGAAAREYSTEEWRIGIASPSAPDYGWAADGVVDDVRIYDRALSPAEVADLAAMGGGGGGGGSGGPGPVFEGFADASASSTVTSLDVPKPAGTAAGDLLIAALATDGDSATSFSPPAGWTPISVGTSANNRVSLGVWWKIATGGEPAQYNFTWSGSEEAYGWVSRFTGHDPASPIIYDNGTLTNDSTSTPICQRLVTTEDSVMILRLGGFDDDDITIGNPGLDGHTAINMDKSGTGAGTVSGGSGYFIQTTAGDSDVARFQLTNNEEMRTVTLGIRPAP